MRLAKLILLLALAVAVPLPFLAGVPLVTADDKAAPGDPSTPQGWGAKGDGTTDDTAAVRRWLEWAASGPELHGMPTGRRAVVPPGVYLVTDTIAVPACRGLVVEGASPEASRFVFQPGRDAGGKPLFELKNAVGHRWKGVGASSQTPSRCAWLQTNGAKPLASLSCRNVWENCSASYGAQGPGRTFARGWDFDNAAGGGPDANGDFWRLAECQAHGMGECGVRVAGSQVKGWAVERCLFYSESVSRNGVRVETGGDGRISQCYFAFMGEADVFGNSLWGWEGLHIADCTSEVGRRFFQSTAGGYEFKVTVERCYCRDMVCDQGGIVHHGKGGTLAVRDSVFMVQRGTPSITAAQLGAAPGFLELRNTTLIHKAERPNPRQLLSVPASWKVDAGASNAVEKWGDPGTRLRFPDRWVRP